MKHIWSIICEKSSLDSNTKLLSIFNIIEELEVVINEKNDNKTNKRKDLPITFQLIDFWSISDKSKRNILDIKIDEISPEGEILNSFKKDFKIEKGIAKFRNIITIPSLAIINEGRYYINISQKDRKDNTYQIVAEIPIDVKISYKLSNNHIKNYKKS